MSSRFLSCATSQNHPRENTISYVRHQSTMTVLAFQFLVFTEKSPARSKLYWRAMIHGVYPDFGAYVYNGQRYLFTYFWRQVLSMAPPNLIYNVLLMDYYRLPKIRTIVRFNGP